MMFRFKQPYTRVQQKDFDRQRQKLAPDAEVFEYVVRGEVYPTEEHAQAAMRYIGLADGQYEITKRVKQYPAGDGER